MKGQSKIEKAERVLKTTQKAILYGCVFLVPFAFSPLFSSITDSTKLTILSFATLIVIMFGIIRSIITGKITVSLGSFDAGVFILAASYLISGVLVSPNKMEAFVFPGASSIILAASLTYFLLNQKELSEKPKAKVILILSSGITCFFLIISLLASYSGVSFPELLVFFSDPGFEPTGSLFATLTLIGVSFILALKFLLGRGLPKIYRAAALAAILLFVFAEVLVTYKLVTSFDKKVLRVADLKSSWVVAVDAIKENPLLGVGPGNYLTAFNKFRPLSYNQTDTWNIRFTNASDVFLTTLTEAGLLGLFGLILIVTAALRKLLDSLSSDTIKFELWALVFVLALFLIFPTSLVGYFVLFILLSLNSNTKEVVIGLGEQNRNSLELPLNIPAILVMALPLVAVIALLFGVSKATVAEAKFKYALVFASENKGKETYDALREAISQNPYVDRYRINYARVNLLLAQSIAAKENLTDADRALISSLIEQAIREGKNSVALNPQRSANWVALAEIYRGIINIAKGADSFAQVSYSQAINLDPLSTDLRITLGGLLYSQGKFDDAIDVFKLAIATKPDHANAHYNLALAYRENGETKRAIAEIKTVLSLVPADSNDAALAKEELDKLENKVATPAKEIEETTVKPPIELSRESAPPATGQ